MSLTREHSPVSSGPLLGGIQHRLDVARQLVHPVARSINWLPLAGSSIAAAVLVHLQTRDGCLSAGGEQCVFPEARIQALRMAAVLIALGAAFVLDDRSEETTLHLPVGRLLRRSLRVGLAVPLVALAWAVSIALARGSELPGGSLPLAALSLELAAVLALSLAASAAAVGLVPEGLGGVGAGPLLLGSLALTFFLPRSITMWADGPENPTWIPSHHRWWIVLACAVAAFVVAGRDPWRTLARRRSVRSFDPRSEPRQDARRLT